MKHHSFFCACFYSLFSIWRRFWSTVTMSSPSSSSSRPFSNLLHSASKGSLKTGKIQNNCWCNTHSYSPKHKENHQKPQNVLQPQRNKRSLLVLFICSRVPAGPYQGQILFVCLFFVYHVGTQPINFKSSAYSLASTIKEDYY